MIYVQCTKKVYSELDIVTLPLIYCFQCPLKNKCTLYYTAILNAFDEKKNYEATFSQNKNTKLLGLCVRNGASSKRCRYKRTYCKYTYKCPIVSTKNFKTIVRKEDPMYVFVLKNKQVVFVDELNDEIVKQYKPVEIYKPKYALEIITTYVPYDKLEKEKEKLDSLLKDLKEVEVIDKSTGKSVNIQDWYKNAQDGDEAVILANKLVQVKKIVKKKLETETAKQLQNIVNNQSKPRKNSDKSEAEQLQSKPKEAKRRRGRPRKK